MRDWDAPRSRTTALDSCSHCLVTFGDQSINLTSRFVPVHRNPHAMILFVYPAIHQRKNTCTNIDCLLSDVSMKRLCPGETITIQHNHYIEIARFPMSGKSVKCIYAFSCCI